MGLLSNKISRDNLKPGDHIYSWRIGYIYSHHGIYVGNEKVIHFTQGNGLEAGIGTFLDNIIVSSVPNPNLGGGNNNNPCPNCGDQSKLNGVISSCLDCFLSGGNIYLFEYNVSKAMFMAIPRGGTCTTATSDPSVETISRANYLLLKKGFGLYDLFKNNCEDFAIYCKTGLVVLSKQGSSGQANSVNAARDVFTWSIAGSVASLSSAARYAVLTSTAGFAFTGLGGMALAGYGKYCIGRLNSDIGVRNDVIRVDVERLVEVIAILEGDNSRTTTTSLSPKEDESFSRNYGDVDFSDSQSLIKWREAREGKKWIELSDLVESMVGSEVLIRGHVNTNLTVSSKLGFVTLRQSGGGEFTVQCVATESKIGLNLIKFLKKLSDESIVDVIGVVALPNKPLIGTSQKVEIQVRKVFCVNRVASTRLPLNVEDAARSKADIQAGKPGANQDIRLKYRVIDLRTQANQAIFFIQSHVQIAFREFLVSKGFVEIHTPKLIAGSSEGGSAVFRLDYKGQPACLAQSPQLHKQMAICGDLRRVFEVGPVFRAEDSFTHRHLCEFVGLDAEMEIYDDYSELMDLVDELFVFIFTKLNEKCQKELEAVGNQFPFQPLKFLPKTLRLTFAEGIQMLKEAGEEVGPLGDLNTEVERKLGQLVLEKYKTEFYILHRYPLGARPFYTMPCADDPLYSNSFDVFIRGEEIISGAQRIHEPELLEKRAKEREIDVKTISTYIDSFRYGAAPHGGFGVGLERVVMLFCALDNIRKTSLFLCDPQRLAP